MGGRAMAGLRRRARRLSEGANHLVPVRAFSQQATNLLTLTESVSTYGHEIIHKRKIL
jgi:hypothetical protein